MEIQRGQRTNQKCERHQELYLTSSQQDPHLVDGVVDSKTSDPWSQAHGTAQCSPAIDVPKNYFAVQKNPTYPSSHHSGTGQIPPARNAAKSGPPHQVKTTIHASGKGTRHRQEKRFRLRQKKSRFRFQKNKQQRHKTAPCLYLPRHLLNWMWAEDTKKLSDFADPGPA